MYSLWCSVLKGKHGCGMIDNGSIIAKPTFSFIEVITSWSYITLFEEWAIGDGCSVKACNDKWLGDPTCVADSIEKIYHGTIHCKVPDLV